MIQLHGAYTALVTPFGSAIEGGQHAVDFARLERNVRDQADGGVSGVVPCGTTGETPTLRPEEYHAVIERTIRAAHPLGLTVIAGAGSNATADAVRKHMDAAEAGADAALHVTPYYNKPSAAGLERHFLALADSCDLPIVLYNVPGRTAVSLTLETIERLAAHPNIVAIKEASGSIDLSTRIIERTDLVVLSGDDPLTLPLMSIGARGVVSVLSNLLPERVSSLCRAALDGDFVQARAINAEILPLARAILSLDTNPVPIKAAMKIAGKDTGLVRLPLVEAAESVVAQLRALVKQVHAAPVGS